MSHAIVFAVGKGYDALAVQTRQLTKNIRPSFGTYNRVFIYGWKQFDNGLSRSLDGNPGIRFSDAILDSVAGRAGSAVNAATGRKDDGA